MNDIIDNNIPSETNSQTNRWNIIESCNEEVFDIVGGKKTYGRNKLEKDSIRIEHQKIIDNFMNFFVNKWYIEHSWVTINSWIDDSVYLIGAPISVLKKYITEESIPEEWFCIHQDCIRTQNIKILFQNDVLPRRGSRFEWIATLVQYGKGSELLKDSIEFLTKGLAIPFENIQIQVSSKDADLISLLETTGSPLVIVKDEKPEKYYTHKYWMWEIVWRNFNFTLREKESDKFNDIWNFIIIENGEKKYWIELALGVSVIMKELFGLSHIMDTSIISTIFTSNDPLYRKFQDCVVSSVFLLRNWVKVSAWNTKGRVLRDYLYWIWYFADKFGVPQDELIKWISAYELNEFDDNLMTWDMIIKYLDKNKTKILSKYK